MLHGAKNVKYLMCYIKLFVKGGLFYCPSIAHFPFMYLYPLPVAGRMNDRNMS